jgi:hypothetical protein
MPLELCAADDRFLDFCLWEYAPATPPVGKLRSINLLLNSLLPGSARGVELIHALRQSLGPWQTVWGIKREGGRTGWEFYFYDYARLARTLAIPRVLAAIAPWVACGVPSSETLPYFMFSLDLDLADLGPGARLDEIDVYIGNPGSLVSSGICYALTAESTRLKNFYFFFNAQTQRQEIVDKIFSSAYLDRPAFDIDEVLLPQLRNCQTIVVANKSDRDGVYFCRIDVRQLLFFLERFDYPSRQVDFVRANLARLDHLRYDVGFDYRVVGGRLQLIKSAYYGCF